MKNKKNNKEDIVKLYLDDLGRRSLIYFFNIITSIKKHTLIINPIIYDIHHTKYDTRYFFKQCNAMPIEYLESDKYVGDESNLFDFYLKTAVKDLAIKSLKALGVNNENYITFFKLPADDFYPSSVVSSEGVSLRIRYGVRLECPLQEVFTLAVAFQKEKKYNEDN